MLPTRVVSATSDNDNLIIHWLGTPYPWVAKKIKLPFEYYLPLKEALEKIVSLKETAYKDFPDTKVGNVTITFHDRAGIAFALKKGSKGIYLLPEDAKDLLNELPKALM